MRWLSKIPPKEKDVRTLVKFAWLPVVIGDVTIWFERYHVLQSYEFKEVTVYLGGNSVPPVKCKTYKWVSVSKRLIDAEI